MPIVVTVPDAQMENIVTAHETGSQGSGLGYARKVGGHHPGYPAGAGVSVLYLELAGEIDAMNQSLWKCRKGMEMWQLVLLVLAIILLLFMIVWFGVLGGSLERLFGKVGELF